MTTKTRIPAWAAASAALALVTGLTAAAPAAAADLSYGYFRTLDGYANLLQASSDSRVDLEINYPVLAGDRVELPSGSRVEAVLPDDTYVRIGGDTELVFDRLALSGDTEDDTTLLRLLYGEIQLEVHRDEELDLEPVRVDTVNATIYLPRSGSYRVASDGRGWTEVVARDGYAEVTTERGSALVRTDERVTVEGDRWAQVSVDAAPARNALERWGEELLLAAREGYSEDLEPSLGYAGASLSRHGSWIEIGTARAWRPYVSVGWRPYHDGWWTYTPSGLTWIAHEPWGWVTHHYGWWDYADPWGWVWYPGYAYTPASVYWYWGPSYVAWVPYGYYRSFYHRYPWRYGVYGWGGGYPAHFSYWTFCPSYAFGRRDTRVFLRTGAQLTRSGELREVPRGIITTDTRPLTPDRWRKPTAAYEALKAAAVRQGRLDPAGDLPDVSDFVARKRELSSETTRAIVAAKHEPVLGRTPVTRSKESWSAGQGPRGETARRLTEWAEGKRPGGDAAGATRGRSVDSGKADYGRGDYGKSEYGRGGVARGGDKGDYGRAGDLRGSDRRGDDGKSGWDARPAPGATKGDYGRYGRGGEPSGSGGVGAPGKGESDSWRDRAVTRRPGTVPGGKGYGREFGGSPGASDGEAPPVRKVLEGVRLYRERSRAESPRSYPSTKDYSRPSTRGDSGSTSSRSPSGSTSSGSSSSYRKPSSDSGSRSGSWSRSSDSSRSGSSARSSGSSSSSRSGSSARSSGSSGSRSKGSASSGSRSGGSKSRGSGSSGGAKRRGG